MTFFSDVWRLPGPGAYVREVARVAAAGQHVLAVVPRFISDDPEYSDALAVAILNELDSHHRIYPSSSNGSLVSALGFAMTDEFDDAPTTVPSLITHDDVIGGVFVCNAIDLDRVHRSELPPFLARLNEESRPVPKSDRGTLIFVLGRDLVDQDPASVAMASLWYWDRVGRWDVAAFLSTRYPDLPVGVLGEVRLETIIEIARWDLKLADDLAQDWTSAGFDLNAWVRDRPAIGTPPPPPHRTLLKRPPEARLEDWDQARVESWHGVPDIAPVHALDRLRSIERLSWRAQSRVLLPWLEVRRVRVEDLVRERLGAKRMSIAVEDCSSRFPGIEVDTTLIELATLARIIASRLGRSERRLRETTRRLVSARNRLSHLRPLAEDEMDELVRDAAWLA